MVKILDTIQSPADIRTLSLEQLNKLALELRSELVAKVALTGGHLAPNLGVVELTLALHTAFDTPTDQLVWDVGHQAYIHKMITGRVKQFDKLRQFGGISGYCKRSESEYDVFGAGHASTSVSAALGLAVSRDLSGQKFKVVAVIGDGALSGGMALEALNNAGYLKKDLIVVLNHNEKSISDNVGAFSTMLARLRTDPAYRHLRDAAKTQLHRIPMVGDLASEAAGRTKRSMKQFLLPTSSGMIFEELGFTFLGPFDGHDIALLQDVFKRAQTLTGPILIQVITQKGKGYEYAEQDSTKYHGVSPFDSMSGQMKKSAGPPTYTEVFARTLTDLAIEDSRIVAITAAMAEGTGLFKFRSEIPERFFDVGIAEQHAVTFAAGLALNGIKPVVAIYSTFLQRAYDQIVHDVCIQNIPVVFAMDRAGIVGDDGATHQGVFDIAYLRTIPNIVLMAPKDENELRHMLYTALHHHGPIALRYPRGAGVGVALNEPLQTLEIGKAEIIHDAGIQAEVTLLAYGPMVGLCEKAATLLAEHGVATTVVNARFAKPLDSELILALARQTKRLVTVEEHQVAGGFGSAVSELLHAYNLDDIPLRIIGLPDEFIEQGTPAMMRKLNGLSSEAIAAIAQELVERNAFTR